MTDHDDTKFANIIGAIAEAFRAKITSATILAYKLALRDLPIETIEAAAINAMQTAKYMPPASELRATALCGGIQIEERTELAWQLLSRTLKRHGYDRTIAFDDPALTATVRAMGGLQRLCEIPTETWHVWTKKQFEQVYGLTALKRLSPESCRPLLGWFDQQNQRDGYFDSLKAPLLIKSDLPALPNAPDVRQLIGQQKKANQLLDQVREEASMQNVTV